MKECGRTHLGLFARAKMNTAVASGRKFSSWEGRAVPERLIAHYQSLKFLGSPSSLAAMARIRGSCSLPRHIGLARSAARKTRWLGIASGSMASSLLPIKPSSPSRGASLPQAKSARATAAIAVDRLRPAWQWISISDRAPRPHVAQEREEPRYA